MFYDHAIEKPPHKLIKRKRLIDELTLLSSNDVIQMARKLCQN